MKNFPLKTNPLCGNYTKDGPTCVNAQKFVQAAFTINFKCSVFTSLMYGKLIHVVL